MKRSQFEDDWYHRKHHLTPRHKAAERKAEAAEGRKRRHDKRRAELAQRRKEKEAS